MIRSLRFLSLCVILALLTCPGWSGDKKSAPAPKAAPAKAAPAVHSSATSGGSHNVGSTSTHGSSASGAGHTTTTTGGRTTTSGPTTTTSGRTTTSGATTTGGHTTAGAASTTTSGHTMTGVGTAGGAGHVTGPGTTAGSGHNMGNNGPGAGHGPSGANGVGHNTMSPGGGRVPSNHVVAQTRSGGSIARRPDGRVASVHDPKRGMEVHRGLNGNRRVVVERHDHSRVFVDHGGRHGYVQRPYMYHGHEYARRSYYYGGHSYNHYYGRYYYRGVYVNPYYPSYYYGPGFYGWAYNPWAAPVAFSWGWGGNPWYGYYGGYFTPYPVYSSPALWLTDYMVATTLQQAYQARVDSNEQSEALTNTAPLTPETKALIAEEVKRQIALENAESQTARTSEPDAASSSIQRVLTDGTQHVFLVGQDLDVIDASGSECALSQGDALQLRQNPPDATELNLVVLASKGGKECPRGDQVSVGLADLQDMQNHMRETIDQGMAELQAKQGKNGLPPAPASATAPPTESVMALNAPPPPTESEVATQLKEESKEADFAEKEAAGDTGGSTATSATPPTVALGQTPDQVVDALGKPKSIMDLGIKKIYVYPDMKVTFKAGKVADIQ